MISIETTDCCDGDPRSFVSRKVEVDFLAEPLAQFVVARELLGRHGALRPRGAEFFQVAGFRLQAFDEGLRTLAEAADVQVVQHAEHAGDERVFAAHDLGADFFLDGVLDAVDVEPGEEQEVFGFARRVELRETEATERAGELEVGDEVRDLRREAAFDVVVFDHDEVRGLERGGDDRRGVEWAQTTDVHHAD